MSLAFTSHRTEMLLFSENEQSAASIRVKMMMQTEIRNQAASGCTTFPVGGARGGDIIFAEQVLIVKATEYPSIRLITVIPHEGQANSWTEVWRERYFRINELSDVVITLSSRYTHDCYHARNISLLSHKPNIVDHPDSPDLIFLHVFCFFPALTCDCSTLT